jgi:kynurenine formamidase
VVTEAPPESSVARLEALAAQVNNWKKWGTEDEIGTLNYITPAKIVEACRLAVSGRVIALGVPLDRKDGPQVTAPRRYNPIHFMDELPADYVLPGGVGVADDVLVLPLQTSTQWDSLAHVAYKGRIYGGRSASLVNSHGASRNSIRGISDKVTSRGVLIDLPRHFGVDALSPGQVVTASDLDAALDRQHVAIGRGDIVLVRTGFMQLCRSRAWVGYHGDAPGLGVETTTWLHKHEIAAVATDTASLEAKPWTLTGIGVPFHVVALTHMGLLLGEIFDLDALAVDCGQDGRYEFLFVGSPLPVTGGVGSYVNPYAIK